MSKVLFSLWNDRIWLKTNMKNQTISSEKVDIVEKSYANSDNIKKNY